MRSAPKWTRSIASCAPTPVTRWAAGRVSPLRDRTADLGHDPRRARGRRALLLLAGGGPLRRDGHHRAPVRLAPHPRSALTPRAVGAALGAVEAAKCARRPRSPDHGYYVEAAARLGANRACLAIARKLLKRSYHTLRELGAEALQPA